MTIGHIMQTIRKERGYTQKQLAEKCGLATGTIQQYELNKREPRREQLQKIATALDVPLYELMGFDGSIRVNINPKDTEAEELIKRQASGESITDEERQKISDYVERIKESFSRLHKSVVNAKNTIEELGENILLSDYRKLNASGKEEAQKRIGELTEIPRYTKPDEPSEE